MNEIIHIGGEAPNNSASFVYEEGMPYRVALTIEGVADILMHRYQPEAVEAKARAAKNSSAKKADNLESYVYRCDDGTLGIPGEYLRQSIITASKSQQDPRSPRKSAMDLYKAAIVSLTPLASLGAANWSYEDRRRAVVQRAAVTRVRPAMRSGWRLEFCLACNTPEYIAPSALLATVTTAGRLVGIGDFRPTYGRFQVVNWQVLAA